MIRGPPLLINGADQGYLVLRREWRNGSLLFKV